MRQTEVVYRNKTASGAATSGASYETTLKVTRIAHSCTLLEFGGSIFLADPWFSQKFGYHQGEPVALSPEQLPRLAGVLVSHAHYDHDDIKSLGGALDKDVPMLVEADAVESAEKAGFTNVVPLAPWQSTVLGPVTVTATPAKHGVPEISFIVQARGFTVYFGGDTLLIPEPTRFRPGSPSIRQARPSMRSPRNGTDFGRFRRSLRTFFYQVSIRLGV